MRNRNGIASIALVAMTTITASNAQESNFNPPRTEFGHPDFQGNWHNLVVAPMERREELGNKRAYSPEEAEDFIASRQLRQENRPVFSDPDRPAPPAGELITNIADGNFIPELNTQPPFINGEYRTSFIIDPPNGRIASNEEYQDNYLRWISAGYDVFDGPEIRPANERCLNSPGQVPLVIQIGPGDSKTMQIVQTEDYVILNAEYATSIRIVPLQTKSNAISWPQWRGVSIGRFEGESLVVTTRDFRVEQSNPRIRTSPALTVTEKFTMTDANELLYRFTFADEQSLEQPFTGEIPLQRMAEGEFIYESSCHEGNYALRGVLAGARRADVDAEFADQRSEQ